MQENEAIQTEEQEPTEVVELDEVEQELKDQVNKKLIFGITNKL